MKFFIRKRQDIVDMLSKMDGQFDGKMWIFTIEPFKRKRTNPQNAKFHAMIRELAIHTGHTEAEMKYWIKQELGFTKDLKVGDKISAVPMDSSEYNVEQMSEAIERMYATAGELGYSFEN